MGLPDLPGVISPYLWVILLMEENFAPVNRYIVLAPSQVVVSPEVWTINRITPFLAIGSVLTLHLQNFRSRLEAELQRHFDEHAELSLVAAIGITTGTWPRGKHGNYSRKWLRE